METFKELLVRSVEQYGHQLYSILRRSEIAGDRFYFQGIQRRANCRYRQKQLSLVHGERGSADQWMRNRTAG